MTKAPAGVVGAFVVRLLGEVVRQVTGSRRGGSLASLRSEGDALLDLSR